MAGDGNTYYSGMHTAILMEPFDGETALFVDSNFVAHWTVGKHSWNSFQRAREHGFTVGIWRYGS